MVLPPIMQSRGKAKQRVIPPAIHHDRNASLEATSYIRVGPLGQQRVAAERERERLETRDCLRLRLFFIRVLFPLAPFILTGFQSFHTHTHTHPQESSYLFLILFFHFNSWFYIVNILIKIPFVFVYCQAMDSNNNNTLPNGRKIPAYVRVRWLYSVAGSVTNKDELSGPKTDSLSVSRPLCSVEIITRDPPIVPPPPPPSFLSHSTHGLRHPPPRQLELTAQLFSDAHSSPFFRCFLWFFCLSSGSSESKSIFG